MLRKYIGDRAFYRPVIRVALPMIIQNGISNFVSLLDNIMVGQVGTLPMSGVSIVNQIMFVFYLCIFGASAGAGIFTAQYHGSRDNDGIRYTFRFKVLICTALAAVAVNLCLNYVLIFGHFGAPAMGVAGAAVATVISRFVELGIVVIWTHCHGEKNPFIRGAWRSFYIPGDLLGKIFRKGVPLLINEFLWSFGMATLSQCYSTCGLDVVPAFNIASTLSNLGSVVYLAMGNAVGILMGRMLGARESEENLRDANRKLVFSSTLSGLAFGAVMALFAGVFPMIYNTTGEVRSLASRIILITSGMMVFYSYANASYFTLRSGGKTLITFLFDSGFLWVCTVPLAFGLSRFTGLPIVPLYMICQFPDVIKCFVGYFFLKKGSWIQNLT